VTIARDGWIVNLGIGIPTLSSNFDFGDMQIIFHAENGVIGYGPLTGPGREDLHLVDAGLLLYMPGKWPRVELGVVAIETFQIINQ
jgi:acyl CoA:acetate/3-ketoacid CoA transferase beta subunit